VESSGGSYPSFRIMERSASKAQRWRAGPRQGDGVVEGLGEAIGAIIDADGKVFVGVGTADTAGPSTGDAVGVVVACAAAPMGAAWVGLKLAAMVRRTAGGLAVCCGTGEDGGAGDGVEALG